MKNLFITWFVLLQQIQQDPLRKNIMKIPYLNLTLSNQCYYAIMFLLILNNRHNCGYFTIFLMEAKGKTSNNKICNVFHTSFSRSLRCSWVPLENWAIKEPKLFCRMISAYYIRLQSSNVETIKIRYYPSLYFIATFE